MARTVYITPSTLPGANALTSPSRIKTLFKEQVANSGKFEIIKGGVEKEELPYAPMAYTGKYAYVKQPDYAAMTFPEGTPLSVIAAKVYPNASGAGMELIKQNNSIRTTVGPLGRGLAGDQRLLCPDYVEPINNLILSTLEAKKNLITPFRAQLLDAFGSVKKWSLGVNMGHPDYIEKQLGVLKEYADEDLEVLSFFSEDAITDPGSSGSFRRIKGITSISCRDSLFEGSRVFKFKMPIDDEFRAGPEHRHGNHIAVSIKGTPVFMGLMINPKVDTKKGKTLEWVCVSHSYTLIKSHFNPSTFHTEWRNITPLEAVRYVSNVHGHPVWVGKDEQEALSIPYEDDDGLRNMGNDIRTSTPFKFLQKLVSAIGRFLHPSVTGFLEVQSIDVGQEPTVLITDGSVALEDLPLVLGTFTVRYNFDELAGNYMVMEQKKKADGAQMVQLEHFPIRGLFKNIARDEAAPLVLSNVSKLVGLDEEDPYTPFPGLSEEAVSKEYARRDAKREKRKAIGATLFEVSKAMANAVKIDIEVPGWYAPDGIPWRTGMSVYVRSTMHALELDRGIISSVDFRRTNMRVTTALTVTLSGAFDAVFPRRIPFLTAGGEDMRYVVRSYEELLQDSKGNQSVEYD